MQKWSNYERQVRENFDRFMEELQLGDMIDIYHGQQLEFSKVKVEGIVTRDFKYSTGLHPTIHFVLRPKYGDPFEQPIDRKGSKTPWFDGPFVIYREHKFQI